MVTALVVLWVQLSLVLPTQAAGPYYLNEMFLNPPGTDAPNEYVELRGTANAVLPTGTYLVGIEGDVATAGDVQTIFNLSGATFGSNGYLVLRQFNNTYVTAAGATVLTSTATGWSGLTGFSADSPVTDIENQSVTFLLLQSATAPTLTDDIDSDNNGTPDGTVYAGWTIYDGISILDGGATDTGYADVVFSEDADGLTKAGVTVTNFGFSAQIALRNGDSTGSTASDWIVSDALGGTAPNWLLNNAVPLRTLPASFANKPLDHIGSSNFPVPTNQAPVVFGLGMGISGVVGDPTQPVFTGAGNGFDFTVSDAETAADTITVTIANGNPAVLSSVAVVDTGDGAWRLDLGTPAGARGYSNVTVTANDGVGGITNVIFKYGASLDDASVTTDRYLTYSAEASTALALDANWMIVGDDENQGLRTYSRTNSGAPVATTDVTSLLGLTDISGGVPREVDIEGSTRAGNTLYFMGSHSNSSGGSLRPNRSRLFAMTITGTGAATTLSYVGRYDTLKTDLIAWDTANGHGLGANALGLGAAAANGVIPEQGGYNMEGLTFLPGSTINSMVGFRSPLKDNKAIVVVVNNLPALTSGNPSAGPASFEALFLLDLGGRGVRSIECNATDCLILAGSPGPSGDFKFYTWTIGSAPVERATNLNGGTLNPEGIVEVPAMLDANSQIQIISDNGDADWYGDSLLAGDLNIVPHQKFRTDTFTLGAAPEPAAPVINEFTFNHVGTDTNEYLEAAGSPNTNYSAYSLLVIEGDPGSGASVGAIDRIYPLGTTNGSGIWVTPYINNQLENGTQTVLLVKDFSGALGADLDTNDDGTLDSTPWSALADAIAVNDGGASDRTYGLTLLGSFDAPSGFTVGGASRIPNGTDTDAITDWVRNDFDLAGIPSFTGSLVAGEALNTPGAVNSTTPPDVAPVVMTTSPADDAMGVGVDSDIVITFSEPVTVTEPWVSVVCSTSGTVTTVISGGAQTYTVNPALNLFAGETCTVTITAAQVVDQDGTPNALAADYLFDFTTIEGNVCSTAFTPIYSLQENGVNFGVAGPFTVEGIVTGDFQNSAQLNGFFIQAATGDGNGATSDGIFVYDPQPVLRDVVVGQRVRVAGTVSEFIPSGAAQGQTQINATLVADCGDTGTITPQNLTLPFSFSDIPERYESMLVSMTQTLYVNDVFNLGRYGETSLSSGGRLINPTNVVAPGAPAIALQASNNLNKIVLDDGLSGQNPDPNAYLQGSNPTLRTGDITSAVTGILTYGDSSPAVTTDLANYRIQPTVPVVFSANNPRPTAPVRTGELRVISFNVLNFFNGDGLGGGFPTSRGASNATELQRQRDKIVAAITQLNPDVAGLIELENDTGANSALAELVNALNVVAGAGTYAYIETGMIGTDAIRNAFIYKPAAVTPVGSPMIDNDAVNNRPTLAQTFEQVGTGARFNVVVNHFKSKGCGGATGLDADLGDGQSCFNETRSLQAQQLNAFINSVVIPTSADGDVLVIGDLNSYLKEDPILLLESFGFTNLLNSFGNDPYSYVFFGQSGSLDHALATSVMAAQVVNVTEWHINGDEPSVVDYNLEFKSNAQDAWNVGTPYRSSDHDPVVIDLDLANRPATPTPIAPIGVSLSLNPIFKWSQVADAEYYGLWLSKGANNLLNAWYYFGDVCDGTTCSIQLPFNLTEAGEYSWWVQSWKPVGGYSGWSAETVFSLATPPATPTPIAPVGDIIVTNPLFSWNATTGATHYHVWVSRLSGPQQGKVTDAWLDAATVCSGATCSIDLGLSLERGAYGWWVQAWSSVGGYSAWSGRTDFNVVLPVPAPTPIAPIGNSTDVTPDFTFSRVAGVSWYYLWLSSGPNKVLDIWYQVDTICNATICTITPGLNLGAGNYRSRALARESYAASAAVDETVSALAAVL